MKMERYILQGDSSDSGFYWAVAIGRMGGEGRMQWVGGIRGKSECIGSEKKIKLVERV